jgi:glutathione S-transferase
MSLPQLKLISHKLCPYVQRARIVLDEKSIPYEIEFIDLANRPDWFRDISPLGKVPVLLVDGVPLFESAVIVEYLDEITAGSMHPTDPFDKARNRAWIEFASNTLSAIGGFYSAKDQETFEAKTELLRARFRTLENILGDGPYFNGDQFSLVDAAFGPVFRYFDVIERYADFGLFAETPKVRAWRRALRQRPSVQRAAVEDYASRLHQFFLDRNSILTNIIRQQQAA